MLLVLEIKVPSFGLLGVGGTISLIFGSVMMTGNVPGVQVEPRLIVPVVLGFAASSCSSAGWRSPPSGGRR